VPEGAEIFRLEDGLDAIRTWLDAVTGEPTPEIEIAHLLKRESRKLTLSRQDVAIVRNLYAADYQRFDYSLPEIGSDLHDDKLAWIRSIFAWLAAPLLVMKHHRDWLR